MNYSSDDDLSEEQKINFVEPSSKVKNRSVLRFIVVIIFT